MLYSTIDFSKSLLISDTFKNAMRILGAYGIIVVFAQDVGVRTGCRQAIFTQHPVIQFFVFTAVAFSVSDDLFQSIMGTFIYFVLKYVVSKGRVNDACFPSECEIHSCESTPASPDSEPKNDPQSA